MYRVQAIASRCIAGAALLASALAGQRTWIVDAAGGPGVHFTEVQPAINAATAGDRIQVRGTGVYPGFTVDRGIAVEAMAGAGSTSIIVTTIPVGQTAAVVGFGTASPTSIQQVLVANCAGAVRVQEVTVNTSNRFLRPLQVTNSPQVYLRAVRIDTRSGAGYEPPPRPAVGLVNSRVVFDECAVFGSPGVVHTSTLHTSAALEIDATSFAVIDGGLLQGGAGLSGAICGTFCCMGVQPPSPAVVGQGNCVVLGNAQVIGGAGGSASGCQAPPQAPAFSLTGTLWISYGCIILPGCGGCFGPRLTSLDTPPRAGLGSNVTLSMVGVPNDIAFVARGFSHGFLTVPGFSVPWLLSSAFAMVGSATLSTFGLGQVAIAIPNDPALLHLDVFFQAVTLAPSTMTLSLGGTTSLHIH